MFPMPAAAMHHGLERRQPASAPARRVLAGDQILVLPGPRRAGQRLRPPPRGPRRGRRSAGGGDDVEPPRVRRRGQRHQQARGGRGAAEPGVEGARGRPRRRAHRAGARGRRRRMPSRCSPSGIAGDRRHRPRRRAGRAQPRRARRGTAAAARRARDRRGGARVQLGHDRPAEGGAPHPPLDRARHPALGATRSGSVPTTASRSPRRPSHILGLLNLLAAAEAGATVRLHARFDLDELLRRIESERMTLEMAVAPIALAMANHPRLEELDLSSLRYIMWGATPVSESVAEVVTERTGVRWLPAYGASELPVIACQPGGRARALAARLGRPAPAGGRAAGRRPRHRRGAPAGRGRRDPGAQPLGDGRVPPGGGERRGLRRRLVPHRRRRLARARGLGPPHRPLEGDDQGQRLPGGAGRGGGRAARPPRGARLRGVRHRRRAGRRGAGGGGAARSRPDRSPSRSSSSSSPTRWPPTSTCATSSSSTPSRGCRPARCCAARCATSGRRSS